MIQKPGTPSSMPSKTVIFNWVKQIVPQSNNKMKVQDLGDGVIYCKIMNHYFPGSISLNRLNNNPKNEYDNTLNLKLFQNALTQHKLTVPFDVGKIAKQKFLQNWGLLNALYRQLSSNTQDSLGGDDSKSVSYMSSKFTPKRPFESAFPNDQIHKLPEVQTFAKPVYNHPTSQTTIHYQSNQGYTQQQMANTSHHTLPQKTQNNHYFNQPQIPTSNMITHSNQPINQNIMSNHSYGSSGITQTAFGGFNFGTSNNIHSLNYTASNNSNLQFNRGQINTNNTPRQIIPVAQPSKTSGFDQATNKCWSVGKLPIRQSISLFPITSQQNSGKYSVNSHIFQNNYNAVIDRVKQILLKNSHDIQKIRQIKILLNIPLGEDMIKIQEEQNIMINCTNSGKINNQSGLKEKELKKNQENICTKQAIEGSKEIIEIVDKKSVKQVSSCEQKQNQGSKSISNAGSHTQTVHKNDKNDRNNAVSRVQHSSGKKIRNNFFGQGSIFRK